MKIAQDKVVSIHYVLRDKEGEVLDNSEEHGPLAYLHGHGNIIPGLEKELMGKESGDKLHVTVAPEDAYGIHDESLIKEVSPDMFKDVDDFQEGMQFQAQTEQGMQIFTVTAIEPDKITIDGNHPLAGEELTFDVEVTEVREATSEELEHGHVHGPHGHHH